MNVIWESKNGMAMMAIWQDISDLREDRRRCLNGAVTYLIGRGAGVWGHDALPALDALIAKKNGGIRATEINQLIQWQITQTVRGAQKCSAPATHGSRNGSAQPGAPSCCPPTIWPM